MLDRGRVRELYCEACEMAGAERAALLDRECGGDAALRAEVESLLKSAAERPDFMGSPTAGGVIGEPPREGPGTWVGPYRVLEEIGKGGFGTVYMAEQERPVKRRVAVKVIKLGMDTREVIARFEAERQALAMMEHPGIASVYDAGSTASGRPYFVMELVRGAAITRYCDGVDMTVPERLRLFGEVCGAVQHAHQKGVIHRDLKPANVLVTERDGRACPKVIDFGIAKATTGQLIDRTLVTDFRQFVGTPEYMSPEQSLGAGLDVDTRSDIYSLGVMLYELLTGTTPLDGASLWGSDPFDVQRMIREAETPRPSTRFSSLAGRAEVAAHRRIEPRRLGLLLRGDLDWIVLKALEKDRSRRYETASALGEDVRRYLALEPVSATPPSAAYRTLKFVRRHRTGVAAALMVLAVLVLGIAGTSWGLVSARAAGRRSRAEADRATTVRDFLSRTFEGVSPQVALGRDTALVGQLMDNARARIESGELKGNADAEAELRLVIAGVYADIARFGDAERVLRPLRDGARTGRSGPLGPRMDLLSGRIALATGDWDAARTALDAALAASTDDRGRAESLSMLGEVAINRNEFDRSIALHRRAVGAACAVAPRDDQLLATCLSRLGAAQAFCGKNDDAAETIAQVMAIVSRPEWSDSPMLIESLNAKSMLLINTRPQDAVHEMRSVVESARRIFPSPHPMIALSLHNLGAALYYTGDFQGALVPAEEALGMRRRLFGNDSPETVESLVETGSILGGLGRHDEAMRRERAAISAFTTRAPGGSYDEAHERMMLAASLRSLGRLDEAIEEYAQAAEGLKSFAVEDDPKVLGCVQQFASCLRDAGHLDRSADTCRDLVRLCRARTPVVPHQVATAQFMLGDVLLDIDTPEARTEAESALRECLDTRRRTIPDGHPDVLARHYTACLLGCAILRQLDAAPASARVARIHEAEDLLLGGHQGIEATASGPGTPDRASKAAGDLAKLYDAWELLEPGAGHGAQAAHWRGLAGLNKAPER